MPARTSRAVQIIANAFRLKPLEEVFPTAAAAGIGIIARVPLASGLLPGRYDEPPAQAAIAWLWQHDAVASVIPGARSVAKARANANAGRVAPLPDTFDAGVGPDLRRASVARASRW